MGEEKKLSDIATVLRRDSLQMTSSAGSGHPTSCLSCAEIMSVLFFHVMRYDPLNAHHDNNDEFILSKGHAAAIYYATLARAGCLHEALGEYRKISSPLEGHPLPTASPWVKVASGSLGQGLGIGVGMALAAKLAGRSYRTYVLLGDSELAEGSVYEAAELAAVYKLDNLCAIVDVNRLGQRGETMVGHDLTRYRDRFKAFGWNTIVIDGHNIVALVRAFTAAQHSKRPTVLLAKTFKGKGVSFLSDKEGWHGKALSWEELRRALTELPDPVMPRIQIMHPVASKKVSTKMKFPTQPSFTGDASVATREAYGEALGALAKINTNVLAIDAEVSNSTFAEKVKSVAPKQFIEAYIAEQNMIGMALGLSIKGYRVFASSFAAFLSRAHDQLRMSAYSRGTFTVCGSHAGISIGEDGASQMGLEDIAMMRDLPESTVLYPSDAVSAAALTYLAAAQQKGITYLRTTRPKTPVLYKKSEKFSLGDFKVLKKSKKDSVVLVGAGITTHEALKAHEKLKEKKIASAVVDLYCIKPFNANKFISFVQQHGSRIVIAEDHYDAGGIGEMLAEAVANEDIKMAHLAVREIPHSGKKEELLAKYGIDVSAYVKAAQHLNR